MHFDIKPHTIFLTLAGSRVYGTATEQSDHDYRGVAIPPKSYFLGTDRFDQHEVPGEDCVVYGINKFLHLAAQNNPNVLELLFVDPKFWQQTSIYWEQIHAVRDAFLSKKCYHTYRGYAASQIKRVRSHRNWLLQGDVVEPKRSDFGLDDVSPVPSETIGAADALVQRFLGHTDVEEDLAHVAKLDKTIAVALRQRMQEFLEQTIGLVKAEIDQAAWTSAAKQLGYATNFVDLLQREKQYQQAKRHYRSWLHWKQERNPARKEIEERCGFDGKHMLHCFRLMQNCSESLRDHTIRVERPDAEFLREIRTGRYSFEELEERYETLDKELEELYRTSNLRSRPQHDVIRDVGVAVVEQHLRDFGCGKERKKE